MSWTVKTSLTRQYWVTPAKKLFFILPSRTVINAKLLDMIAYTRIGISTYSALGSALSRTTVGAAPSEKQNSTSPAI